MNTDQTSTVSLVLALLPKPDQLLRAHTRTIVSQARPFQYDSESYRRCGTEGYSNTHDASNTQTMCSKWSLSVSRDVHVYARNSGC